MIILKSIIIITSGCGVQRRASALGSASYYKYKIDFSGHCETSRMFVDSSTPHLTGWPGPRLLVVGEATGVHSVE